MDSFETFQGTDMDLEDYADGQQAVIYQSQNAMLFNVDISMAISKSEDGPTEHPVPTQPMENKSNTSRPLAESIDLANDDNNDDDTVMISLQDASEIAQQRWAEKNEAPPLRPNNKLVVIKQELKEYQSISVNQSTVKDPNNSHQLLEAQKMMLARMAANENHDVGPRNISGQHMHAETNSLTNQAEGMEMSDEPRLTEATTGAHDDDDGWMNAAPEEDEEYRNLTETRDTLQSKINNGKATNIDTYDLYRIKNRLQTLDRLKLASRGYSTQEQPTQEELLFVEDNIGDQAVEHQMNSELADNTFDQAMTTMAAGDFDGFSQILGDALGRDSDSDRYSAKKSDKPRKKPGKRPKDAREFYAREKARLEGDRTRARHMKESRVGESSKTKGKKKSKKNGTSTISKSLISPDGFDAQNGADSVGAWIIDDLVKNNPIEDRLNNPVFDASPEPEITGGQINKKTQLQTLVSNIPQESSPRTVKGDKKKLQLASQSFGYAKVRAVNGKWLVRGMKSTLYHHQLLGAQWMVSRELSEEAPNGGLLADSMGLGKTIQTLACMVGNPPSPEDLRRDVKATLIVVPAAVMDQWVDEAYIHVDKGIFKKVYNYKSSTKMPAAILQDCDIVITAYSDVTKEFPFPDKTGRTDIRSSGLKKWTAQARKEMGALHQVNWYRVVLDEAHAIKNNSSRTSLSCQNLKSVYRWCLTGTPILNRVEELFPYLRFLRANCSMDMPTFQKYFCNPDTVECQNRVLAVLSYTMMRRTMATTIMGRPIVTLPKPHPKIEYVDFSEEEKIIYRITENRFRQTLNMFIAKGDVRRKYGTFMVQLLRLRQCTSHPFMLERTIKESWTLDDVNELKEKLSQLNSNPMHVPFYEQTKVWVQEAQASKADSGADDVAAEKHLPFGRGAYGTNFNMDKVIGLLSEKETSASISCGLCDDVPQEPMETNCGHIFCEDCLESYMHSKAAEHSDIDCPCCSLIITQAYKLYRHSLSEDDELASSESGSQPRRGQGKQRCKPKVPVTSKGRDVLGFESYTPYSDWLTQTDTDAGFPLVPSAKTASLKSILLKGFSDAPLDKVVIYVQFRALARIVGRMCKQEGWKFIYLSGDCAVDHRTSALKMFRNDPEITILIAGLKCGGIGLNFPWANRCISLDLWWNHGVEQQAFGRIFRIGQNKETYMTRIVVKNSVDMRLLTMQGHKLRDVDRTITESDTKPNLSLNELANLFGFLRTDADGEIVSIEPDYEDDDAVPSAGGN